MHDSILFAALMSFAHAASPPGVQEPPPAPEAPPASGTPGDGSADPTTPTDAPVVPTTPSTPVAPAATQTPVKSILATKKNSQRVRVLPLVGITGTTEAVGTLTFSPAFLIGTETRPRTWALFAPTVRASTSRGSSTVDLRDVRSTPGAAVGGSVTVYHHSKESKRWYGLMAHKDLFDHADLLVGIDACDVALNVPKSASEPWKCDDDKDPTLGKQFCAHRKNFWDDGGGTFAAFSSAKLCTAGWQAILKDGTKHSKNATSFTVLSTQHAITFGALTSAQSFEHLKETEAMQLAETTTRRWDVRTGAQYAVLTRTKRMESRYSFTVELTGAYGRVHSGSTTSGEWCVQDPRPVEVADGGQPVQTCKTAAIGGPGRKQTIEGSVLFGGIDVKELRWRFAAGVHVKSSLTTAATLVALELPIHIRLTKQSVGPFVGPYEGILRVRPVVGPEIVGGKVDGVRLLLVLDLLGQNGLWGGQAFSWL